MTTSPFAPYASAGEPGPRAVSQFIAELLEREGALPRSEIVQAVKDEWVRVSGRPFKANVVAKVKKALSEAQAAGTVNAEEAKGWWRASDPESSKQSVADQATGSTPDLSDLDELETNEIESEHTVGAGDQFIYAYYIPVYRELFEAQGSSRWPIKIGKSIDAKQRLNTHATALPDAPTVAVLIKTSDAANLERLLHLTLRVRGREYDGTGGSEWFVTSPQEILEIYAFASSTATS